MKTAPVMCLLIVLYSTVDKQTHAKDVTFNFRKFVKESKVAFLKDAEVDALNASKNVLQKFGAEFTEFSEAQQLRNDDINRAAYGIFREIFGDLMLSLSNGESMSLAEKVCMAGRLPFPEEFVVRHEDLVEEVDELLAERCHDSGLRYASASDEL